MRYPILTLSECATLRGCALVSFVGVYRRVPCGKGIAEKLGNESARKEVAAELVTINHDR